MSGTVARANGKWRSILGMLGIDSKFLRDKHGPCPLCGGDDRYRWDNKEGKGGYFCSQCGAGYGIDLVMKANGWDFGTAAREIDNVMGEAKLEKVRKRDNPEAQRRKVADFWKRSIKAKPDGMVYSYLRGRVPGEWRHPPDLRFMERCPVPSGGECPAMVAAVRDLNGKGINVHRTFLGPNGKADMSDPRAMMPGRLPDGCAVRLAPAKAIMGIAEGIETAIAASVKFKMPVWSAINATMLAKWIPPEEVEEVHVFGDNDAKFAGQAAAYALASRLAGRMGLRVQVHIPERVGTDWAD